MEIYILFLFVATLIVTPLVFFPLKFNDGYILPQYAIGTFGIGLTLIPFVWQGDIPYNTGVLFAVGFFIYFVMTGVWSSASHNSLRELPLLLLCVGAYIIGSVLFQNRANIVGASLGVFAVAMLTCIYGICQKFVIDPFLPQRLKSRKQEYINTGKIKKFLSNRKFCDSRVISTIGNTNFACGFFLSTLPFLIFLTIEVSAWFFLSILVVVVTIILTNSRAGIIALVTIVIGFLLLISKRSLIFDILMDIFGNMHIGAVIGLCVSVLGIGVSLFLCARENDPLAFLADENNPVNTMLEIEQTSRTHATSTLRYRFRYWRIAWELLKRRPLQGYGLRTYRKEVYETQAWLHWNKGRKFLNEGYQTPQPRECHNDFIEFFVEGGFAGGLLFLFLVGHALCVGINYLDSPTSDFLLMVGILAGLFGVMVMGFFFFPFKLASSAIMFFTTLAMIEALSGQVVIFPIGNSFALTVIMILILVPLFWESALKPNIGNFFFSMSNFSQRADNKEKYLLKAIKYCPRESIFRTHALIGYLETMPEIAQAHGEVLRNYFDGMVPAWAMMLNSGIAEGKCGDFEKEMVFLQRSLYYLHYFSEAQQELNRIFPLTPMPRGGLVSKKITDEGKKAIMLYENDIKNAQQNLQNTVATLQITICNVILNEKIKLRIPEDWIYHFESGMFLMRNEIPKDFSVMEMGPTKLFVAIKTTELPKIKE